MYAFFYYDIYYIGFDICFIPEGFSVDDQTLMKAKINFTATVVGNHPNILKFIGAVVEDPASKNQG